MSVFEKFWVFMINMAKLKKDESGVSGVDSLQNGTAPLASGERDQAAVMAKPVKPARPARVLDDLRAGTTKSLNAALIERLRSDLLSGQIPPNTKLKIPAICERYEVSAGVAREALSRLVPDGLIDFTDQRGFRTPTLTVESILDITRVRLLIEREALIESMKNGTHEWEAQILAAQHRLQRFVGENDSSGYPPSEEWAFYHKEFHRALIAGCGSPWLIRMHNLLYDQTERFRFIAAKGGNIATGERRDIGGEHGDIAKAVMSRDVDLALKLMEHHLVKTSERALAAADLDQAEG